MAFVRSLAALAGLRGDDCALADEALHRFQSRRLRALVQHAYARVPFYRRHYDRAGLTPGQVRGIDDLERIPPVTRADLQRCAPDEVVARGVDPAWLVEYRTSGSTGAPLTIRRTPFEDRLLQAHRLKRLLRLGLRLRDLRASIEDQPRQSRPLHTRLGLLRYETVDCLLDRGAIAARVRALDPDVLRGYAGSLAWLADAPAEELRGIAPRFVTSDSEMLTDAMRTRIERAFGAPVVDFYDSHEFNLIAWQPPGRRDYEVSTRSVLVEVLREGAPVRAGEAGDLVGTALHSWAMPFIRYVQGDEVVLGRERRTLARIHGRVADRFVLPGGRTFHPFSLVDLLMEHAPWMLQYQVVQEPSGRVRVRLLARAGERPPEAALGALRTDLRAAIGAACPLEVELVDRIAPGANGKSRPYCRVDEAGEPLGPG